MARRYFLTYCILTSCLVAGQPPQYALKGQTVVLKPEAGAQPDGFLWKHDGNKVAEFNGNEEDVYNPYKNRITLDWLSAEIHITDLRFEDSGEYELEQVINKGMHRSSYRLEVIDKVSKPTITCEMNNGSGSLLCSAEPSPPQIEWRSLGQVQPGPTLPIPLGGEHDDEVHVCTVNNTLSSETAEFTAKDCYTDNRSTTATTTTTAVIASLVSIAVLMVLGILLYKLRHKVSACFANDVENQPQPGTTKGSDKMEAQENENTPLMTIDRKPTLPSTQRLRPLDQTNNHATSPQNHTDSNLDTGKAGNTDCEEHEITPVRVKDRVKQIEERTSPTGKSPPLSPRFESPPPLDLNNLAGNDKADEDAEQPTEPAEEKVPQYDAEDSEKENEPDPAEVSDDSKSDQELYNEPELQGLKTTLSERDSELSEEPEKEADEDEEAPSAPASVEASPSAQPRSPSTENSPNVAPEDTAGEHKDGANSDQVTGENVEENVKDSDSSDAEEINEPDDLSEDKQSSTVPEQKGSETPREQDSNLPKEETPTEEHNEQDTVEPVSENENKTNSQGSDEDEDKDKDLQPQSPTPTKPDNRSQESPEKENKTRHDSDESEGQSEEDETVEDKIEAQGDPQEEKPVNESLSEDKEGLKK